MFVSLLDKESTKAPIKVEEISNNILKKYPLIRVLNKISDTEFLITGGMGSGSSMEKAINDFRIKGFEVIKKEGYFKGSDVYLIRPGRHGVWR